MSNCQMKYVMKLFRIKNSTFLLIKEYQFKCSKSVTSSHVLYVLTWNLQQIGSRIWQVIKNISGSCSIIILILDVFNSGNMSGDLIYQSLCRVIAHVFSKLLLGHQNRKCRCFYTTAKSIMMEVTSVFGRPLSGV
jgi:hypothetical protein